MMVMIRCLTVAIIANACCITEKSSRSSSARMVVAMMMMMTVTATKVMTVVMMASPVMHHSSWLFFCGFWQLSKYSVNETDVSFLTSEKREEITSDEFTQQDKRPAEKVGE